MAVLDVPLHIPVAQIDSFLRRELKWSHVQSVEVRDTYVRIEHHKMTPGEIIAELDGCNKPLTFV